MYIKYLVFKYLKLIAPTSNSFFFSSFQYENKVAVRDRVAFACKFLSDSQVRTRFNSMFEVINIYCYWIEKLIFINIYVS